MEKNLDGQNDVKEYLLGTLDDSAKMRQIEERLMLDDNFEDELSVVEDELIEKYLDDELAGSERQQFESFFLHADPERKQRIRLSQNLRKYAAADTKPKASARLAGVRVRVPSSGWRAYFSLPALRFAALALVVIGVGYGVWRVGFYQSDVEKGLAQLQVAYKDDRRIEARIVGFEYSPPPSVTRSLDKDKPETNEAQLAARILAKALSDKRNAESLYASGKELLAKKDFETAISRFEEAAGLDPQNANIHSDLGAAYLEMGDDVVKKDSTKGLELLDKSLKHLEKAIELNPTLLEPRFNRALCLKQHPERAKMAWNDYIAFDPASKWTDEARTRLKDLNEKP